MDLVGLPGRMRAILVKQSEQRLAAVLAELVASAVWAAVTEHLGLGCVSLKALSSVVLESGKSRIMTGKAAVE